MRTAILTINRRSEERALGPSRARELGVFSARVLGVAGAMLLAPLLWLAGCDGGESATTQGAGPSGSTTSASSGAGGMGGGSGGTGGAGGMVSNAWVMGEPFATTPPTFAAAVHPLSPTERWGALTAPYPTNAAWMDLVLGSGANPVNILPYEVKALSNGLLVSQPAKDVKPTFILSIFNHDLSFETVEQLAGRSVVDHDLLSVTMRWEGVGGGSMVAPLVRGMPYATMVYTALTPRIESAHAITSVNMGSPSPITSDRFEITLNNGQSWVLYASSAVTFNWSASGMAAMAPFTGALRVAALGGSPGAAAELDKHKGAYPTGGDVAVSVTGDKATIDFTWKTEGAGPLLMAAMPHHMDSLVGAEMVDVKFPTIRGEMAGVSGAAWKFEEPLSTITWNAPSGIAADKVEAVKEALAGDLAEVPVAKDPYFFGKQIAKLGRLALIADELGDAASAGSIREQMKTFLDPWLAGTNDNPLRYDSKWGGICSTAGLGSQGADFGNGWYNDHHFHYGYFLYAAAALGKGDATWLTSKKAAVTDLARDIANPSEMDTSFTPFRNKDWFEGHSWAAGLFEFGDGRNQESTSEAVNAWYGLYLVGLASGDKNMENVGRVLLATEIRTAQKYWQIKQGSAIYDEPFAGNKVVGILWGNKVDYTTFFGQNPEFIHGIQMIPFTPITEALLPADWVTEEYPVLSQVLGGAVQEGWKGFIYMDHAIIDPAAAWDEVNMLTGYDDGNTKTNTRYWVATRPTK
jgi:endo-1,3(4)-beta-glucanase